MIDYQQIDELMKNTKLSSMTDVIHFVLDSLVKVINFDPIHELTHRVAQLEKPQGLDAIMIEEVKTLIQAILEQKEQQLKRDLERTVHRNVSIAIEQENTRSSLRELDILELMNSQNNRKHSQQSQPKSPSLTSVSVHQSQLDAMRKEINEMRVLLERKSDRREVNDFRIDLQKELSQKMAVNETEKIVQRFQKDIFGKLSESNTFMQRIEYQVKKSLFSEVTAMKKQLNDSNKIVQLKQKQSKLQKKLKKSLTELSVDLETHKNEFNSLKKQSKDSIDQICTLIENMDSKVKDLQGDVEGLDVRLGLQIVRGFHGAVWLADGKAGVKNGAICWDREIVNQGDQLFKFQVGKSQVVVIEPGYYCIEASVQGCEKSPQLQINGQPSSKLQPHQTRPLSHILSQTLKLSQSNSKVTLKLDSSQTYSQAMLKLTKMG